MSLKHKVTVLVLSRVCARGTVAVTVAHEGRSLAAHLGLSVRADCLTTKGFKSFCLHMFKVSVIRNSYEGFTRSFIYNLKESFAPASVVGLSSFME